MTTPTTQGEETGEAPQAIQFVLWGIKMGWFKLVDDTNTIEALYNMALDKHSGYRPISPLPDKQGESGEQAITNELTKRHAEKSDYRDFRKLGYIAALIDVNNYIDMVESDPKIRVSAFALREFMKNKINEKSNSQSEAF